MGLLFAAIGATITALLDATIAPRIAIGDAGPHPVLIGGVIWTIAAGIDRGITWAFVGGIVLDSLLGRPLGATAFTLLVAVGGAALVAQPFPRLRLAAPILAVPVLSLVYSVLIAMLTSTAQSGLSALGSLSTFFPGVLYDAIIGMFLGPIAITLHDRRTVVERAEW